MTAVSRRSLFTGGRTPVIRPPWALIEEDFLDACSRCGACVDACPTGLLTAGRGGFPQAEFTRGADCDFCGRCVAACKSGALKTTEGNRPWSVTARVAPSCLDQQGVSCRACGDSCSENAIRFRPALGGRTLVEIDAGRCTGCGTCLPCCPVAALGMV